MFYSVKIKLSKDFLYYSCSNPQTFLTTYLLSNYCSQCSPQAIDHNLVFLNSAQFPINQTNIIYHTKRISQQLSFIIKMKKQFSFKDSSRTLAEQKDQSQSNIVLTDYCSNRSKNTSWTDIRVEQIKRKYDTPSHRRRNTNLDRLKTDFSDICLLEKSSNQKVETNRLVIQNNKTNNHQQKKILNNSRYQSRQTRQQNKENKIEEDQILVFQKIKQMKESIMQQKSKKMTGAMSTKTLFYDHQRPFFPLRQYTNKESLDPRIQNIDKINNKIKKILQCLHENESFSKKKNDGSFQQNFSNQDLENSNARRSSFQQTQILARQQIKYLAQNTEEKQEESLKQSSRKKWVRISEPVYLQKIQTNEEKWKKQFEEENSKMNNQIGSQNNSSRNSQMNFGSNLKDMRSKSCLGGAVLFSKKNRQSSSSKKYDDEISKIQQRIKHFQDAKRKLQIQFKPFQYHGNSKSLIFQPNHKKNCEKPPLPRQSQPSTQRNTIKKYEQPSLKNKNFDSKGQTERSQLSSRQYLEKMKKKQKENEQLKRKTDQGMAQRKRKLHLMDKVSINLESIDKLSDIFCRQVDLDEYFRNAKMWLASSCLNDNKWREIQQELQNIGIKMSEDEIIKQFQVVQEEQNPFYSLRQNAETVQSVVEKYRKSKQFWSENVLHKFNEASLKEQKYLQNRIDLEKKGFFIIQDLVRFLNMQSGKFYRNRDLLLLWRRFTSEQKLQFETFYTTLSNQQY